MSREATPGIAGAGEGLQRDHRDLGSIPNARCERRQGHGEAHHAAVRVGDDVAAAGALALHGEGVEVVGVDLGDQQRDVGVHAVVARVGDDRVALRARGPSPTSPATDESRPENSSFERNGPVAGPDRQAGDARPEASPGSRHVQASRVGLARRAIRGRDLGHLEPGMIGSRSWMKRCPTAPVAPRTPTGVFDHNPASLVRRGPGAEEVDRGRPCAE